MFVRNCFCDGMDKSLIYIPDSVSFEFRRRALEGLCLILPDREILLRHVSHWCDEYQGLHDYAVEDLYDDMVDAISEKLLGDAPERVIDIDAIEYELIQRKYKAEWLSKGYISAEEAESLG